MKSAFIYVLKCPLTMDVRYVGKCTNLASRLRQHISESRDESLRSHKATWIRSVLAKGLRPIMEVEAVIAGAVNWKQAEINLIAHYRAMGADLTNATDGGDEPSPLTAEGRRILSERASKIFGTKEGRKRQSDHMKSLCRSPEFVAKRAEAAKATRETEAYKSRQSDLMKKRWEDPAFRAKWSESRKRMIADPMFRQRLSDGVRRAMIDPEVRARYRAAAKKAWSKADVRERQTAAIRLAVSRLPQSKDAE